LRRKERRRQRRRKGQQLGKWMRGYGR